MSTSAPSIYRTYTVSLGTDSMSGCRDRRVVLRYTLEDAEALDPRSPKAINEAYRRAVKLEERDAASSWLAGNGDPKALPAKEHYFLGEVRLSRQQLVR